MGRAREYAARLFLHWLNERWRRAFAPVLLEGEVWTAADGEATEGGRIDFVVHRLFEAPPEWEERRRELEARLDETRPGSYLLWVPPGGALPEGEPDESEWVRRVVLAASKLASGRAGEVRLPVKLTLAKVRDEGGYASVTGGLARYWTTVTEKVDGTYYLDSSRLCRLTRDESERERLFEYIGLTSQGLERGSAVEFETEDAWSVQRLPRGPAATGLRDGWAIAGCPPRFDPTDGAVIRRLLRQRLTASNQALAGARDGVRGLVLIGAYDYAENETASAALRGFDPALTAGLDLGVVVADAEVKPVLVSRGLPWASA
jgi:hypothetical protein